MRIKAQPQTELRDLVLSSMFEKGFSETTYNLDKVSAYINLSSNILYLYFWDMSCHLREGDKNYLKIKTLISEDENNN
jgi:hypothetical protein